MNPSAQNLIDRALRLIGRLASGESPTAQESADALLSLQAMLDAWQNERLLHPVESRVSVTLTGASSYTIGAGGTVAAVRPVALLSAYVRDDVTDYPVSILTRAEYDALSDKSEVTDHPAAVYYEPTSPLGTLRVWPLATGYTLYLQAQAWPFAYTALTDDPDLPPGFADALAYSLAMVLAPEYGVMPSQLVMSGAQASLQGIKTRSAARQPIVLRNDFSGGPRGIGSTPEAGPHYLDLSI